MRLVHTFIYATIIAAVNKERSRGRFFKGTDKTWVALGPSRTQKVWKFTNKIFFFLLLNLQTFWVLLCPSATQVLSVPLKNRPVYLHQENSQHCPSFQIWQMTFILGEVASKPLEVSHELSRALCYWLLVVPWETAYNYGSISEFGRICSRTFLLPTWPDLT